MAITSTERFKTWGIWLSRLILGGLFVAAGILKLGDTSGFAEEIANYQLLRALAPLGAVTLPTIEIILGVLLLVLPTRSPWVAAAALGAAGLYAVFLVGVTQVVIRGIDTSCGCFGASSGTITWLTVGRVFLLLTISVVLVIQLRRRAVP